LRERVAVLGLGLMGRAFARRLEAAGHELVVWNRSDGPAVEFAERGAEVAATPADAAKASEIRVTMLSDGAAVEAVTGGEDGLFTGAGGRGTLVEMSTIDLASSRRLAETAQAAAVGYVRAPVSGNPAVVAAGNLTVLLSGPADAIASARDVIAAIGPNLRELGEADEARVMKLALNLVLGGTTELIAEAVVLAEAAGVPAGRAMDVMADSAIGSPFVRYKRGAVVDRDYTPTFSIANLRKDLRLILDQARTDAVPLPVTEVVERLAAEAERVGLAELDLMALLARLEHEAGRIDELPS
jgi:3-hydroxyisobutyrate dehydrogenase-like beta-hydroxyacid dehydrogenase